MAIVCLASVAVLLSLLLTAQSRMDRDQPGPWKRYVTTPKGDWFDTPTPHTLAHFTRYPALLDESGEFCYLCSTQKRLSMAMSAEEPRAEVHVVGKIRGSTIYDVFYRFHSEGVIDWKSVLVQTGPDHYREIYHDEPNEGTVGRSSLLIIGDETVLGVSDNRYRMEGFEGYWCFGTAGPELLDFGPVWDAARKTIPPSHSIMQFPNAPADFPSLTISVPVWVPGGFPCCDFRGAVKVRFKMKQCRISVTDAEFQPHAGRL